MTYITALGSHGLVGRRLLPLLKLNGLAVRSAGRSKSDASFDWADRDTYRSALTGTEILYLVPPAMVASPAPLIEDLLRIARDVGIHRVVAVSSLGVTFPTEPKGSGRMQFEEVVKGSGIDWVILQPSGFMQNFSEGFMLPAIRQAGIIASAAGTGKVAMIDAGDIAAVAAAALGRPDMTGSVLEITGPEAIDFATIAGLISAAAGRTIGYQAVEEDRMAQMMESAGVPKDYAAMLLGDQRAIRDGQAAVVTTTVLDVTGREPKRFADFVRENADAWR